VLVEDCYLKQGQNVTLDITTTDIDTPFDQLLYALTSNFYLGEARINKTETSAILTYVAVYSGVEYVTFEVNDGTTRLITSFTIYIEYVPPPPPPATHNITVVQGNIFPLFCSHAEN
jgi:hypothetical protein